MKYSTPSTDTKVHKAVSTFNNFCAVRTVLANGDMKAKTAMEAWEKLNSFPDRDVVICDLSLPETPGERPQPDVGIALLSKMMEQYPLLNLVVQSADARALIRLRSEIIDHEGGFTVLDKSEPLSKMLTKLEWSIQGVNFTPRDLEKCCLLLVSNESFINAEQDIKVLTGMKISRSTQHRLVNNYHLPEPKISKRLKSLSVDGATVRLRTPVGQRSEWKNYKAVKIHEQGGIAFFPNNQSLVKWVNQQPLSRNINCLGDGRFGGLEHR